MKIKLKSITSFVAAAVISLVGVLFLFIIYAGYQSLLFATVMYLEYYSFLVLPPLAGILAWGLIYFFGETKISTEEFIERKIKWRFIKTNLLRLLKVKAAAFILSALLLGTLFTPPLIKTCIPNNNRKAYLWAITLNVLSMALSVWIYLGGKMLIKNYWNIIKLSF